MTAKRSEISVGDRLRVLPGCSSCLAAGDVLTVRDRGDVLGLYVTCDIGQHFLMPGSDGTLKDFEVVRDRHYGLLVGDAVEERAFGAAMAGVVVEVSPTDNNRVYVRLDSGKVVRAVAEWCHVVKPDAP